MSAMVLYELLLTQIKVLPWQNLNGSGRYRKRQCCTALLQPWVSLIHRSLDDGRLVFRPVVVARESGDKAALKLLGIEL